MTRCAQCPFETDTCEAYGPTDSPVVFVGQSPGKTEIKQGRPFVGRSGKLLRTVLDDLGMNLDAFYTTNSTLCKLPHDESTPYDNCRPRISDEINNVDPQLIVTLGADAWKSVYNSTESIHAVRGRWFYSKEFDCAVLPTLHPAACLYDESTAGAALRDFYSDLEKVSSRMIDSGVHLDDIPLHGEDKCVGDPDNVDVTVMCEPQEARDFFSYVYRNESIKTLSADIETSGLDFRTDDLLCIGFCTQPGLAYILTPEAIDREVLSKFLTLDDLDFVWHNGKFDVGFLREKGIRANVDHDTMLMSYLLDERSGVHGLEYLAGQHFNAPRWEKKFKREHVKGNLYADVSGNKLWEYNGLDVHYTLRLYQQLRRELDEDLQRAYKNVLIPASNMLCDVERRGVVLDTDHLDSVKQEYQNQLEEKRNELLEYAKDYGWSPERYANESGAKSVPEQINFNSDQQMWFLFFDLMKLPKYHGKRSVAQKCRNWMKSVVKDDKKLEFLDCYEEYKKLRHSYDLYVEGLRSYQDSDNRVRSEYSLHRTATGRLSSRSPNLQNISRNKQIKNAFVVPDGKVLLEADFSQCELRTLAVLSGDEFLLQTYREGKDLHDEMSRRLWGENFTQEQRAITKRVQFGLAYGASAHRVSNITGWDEEKSQQLIDDWYANAPGAKAYFDRVESQAIQSGVVTAPTGRKRRFPMKKGEKYNESIKREARNFPIQSVASDITLLAGVELNKRHEVINLVHDSVVIEADEDNWKSVARDCLKTMPQVAKGLLNTDIPFVADVEVGKRWGELEVVDRSNLN